MALSGDDDTDIETHKARRVDVTWQLQMPVVSKRWNLLITSKSAEHVDVK